MTANETSNYRNFPEVSNKKGVHTWCTPKAVEKLWDLHEALHSQGEGLAAVSGTAHLMPTKSLGFEWVLAGQQAANVETSSAGIGPGRFDAVLGALLTRHWAQAVTGFKAVAFFA